MSLNPPAAFAPQLIIKDGDAAITFFQAAFGAVLRGRWNNDDGTVHVAELSFQGAVFHIREESEEKANLSPAGPAAIPLLWAYLYPT